MRLDLGAQSRLVTSLSCYCKLNRTDDRDLGEGVYFLKGRTFLGVDFYVGIIGTNRYFGIISIEGESDDGSDMELMNLWGGHFKCGRTEQSRAGQEDSQLR